ncbi:dihydrolipoamide acetyltransferase family protein [Mycolicibacterium sp. XJ662]
MTVQEFLVPDLGEGLEDATITGWAVAVGDDVELNQTLCTVETNKAEVEIPSPYAGRIVELGGAEGDTLDVGAVLLRIETEAKRKPVLVGYGADDDLDSSSRRPRAKPSVRKLAAESGVDLNALTPSGSDGVITRDDVLAAADTVTVHGVHAAMAQRMTLSRREIPDAHAGVEVDGSRLTGLPVSPFVLTLRLLTIALRHHRNLNATWVDTADGPRVHLHTAVHLGFAVATERGLLVPVVRNAQDKTTRELAAVVDELIDNARAGTLRPADLQGSTFTVSNFGALGLDDGVPVINYPEAAILGMGSLRPRPVVVDGEVVARPTMKLTCAFDHRVADGAQVAAFLNELRDLVESPERALLDL